MFYLVQDTQRYVVCSHKDQLKAINIAKVTPGWIVLEINPTKNPEHVVQVWPVEPSLRGLNDHDLRLALALREAYARMSTDKEKETARISFGRIASVRFRDFELQQKFVSTITEV